MQTAIVIPCYNEAKRFKQQAFSRFLEKNSHICLCFVNDGSSDGTLQILSAVNHSYPEKTFVLDLPMNKGKAEAVRAGVCHILAKNKFSFVGFWDADLATPLEEIHNFVGILLQQNAPRFVLGTRIKRLGANIDRVGYRHYLSRVFATFTSLTLNMPVYDTQCGAKIFAIDVAEEIFSQSFFSKWFFDIELIFRAKPISKNKHFFYEHPLSQWTHQGESKLTFKDFLFAPIELLRLFWHYRVKKYDKNTN
ncbi:glycosyltransferase [Candidatus Uabimicrobium sp. HlEnr_7]|uniref:glycosyltransferase n=1 Tax=Candidatus Uabimicrobium helgolandensis TaxID=3095367 RepID=UPI0035573696